jgi:hypothetical protein
VTYAAVVTVLQALGHARHVRRLPDDRTPRGRSSENARTWIGKALSPSASEPTVIRFSPEKSSGGADDLRGSPKQRQAEFPSVLDEYNEGRKKLKEAQKVVLRKLEGEPGPWPMRELEPLLVRESGMDNMDIRQAVWYLVGDKVLQFTTGEDRGARYVTRVA